MKKKKCLSIDPCKREKINLKEITNELDENLANLTSGLDHELQSIEKLNDEWKSVEMKKKIIEDNINKNKTQFESVDVKDLTIPFLEPAEKELGLVGKFKDSLERDICEVTKIMLRLSQERTVGSQLSLESIDKLKNEFEILSSDWFVKSQTLSQLYEKEKELIQNLSDISERISNLNEQVQIKNSFRTHSEMLEYLDNLQAQYEYFADNIKKDLDNIEKVMENNQVFQGLT